jgi:hypothetical protein
MYHALQTAEFLGPQSNMLHGTYNPAFPVKELPEDHATSLDFLFDEIPTRTVAL